METQELIVKKLCGELTQEESLLFESWLHASETNQLTWLEAEKAWKLTGKVSYDFEPDTEIALQKLRSVLPADIPSEIRFFTIRRVAAMALLLLSTGFLLFCSIIQNVPPKSAPIVKKNTAPEAPQVKMLCISTSDTAVSFYLPDSTHITLNKNSSFSYPEYFSSSVRKVTLTGEAFFEVKHNDKIPFIVTAGNTETKVLGTSFNIKEDKCNGKVEVSVVTGKVQFTVQKNKEQASQIILMPQDKVTYSEINSSMMRGKTNGRNYWWMKNLKGIRKLIRNISNPIAHK